jgi:glycosyltransferase involved in cell wall biosynthesis
LNDFGIYLFCNEKIFDEINFKYINKVNIGTLPSNNLLFRLFWVLFKLPKLLKKFSCSILFAPGGLVFLRNIYSVTMFRNMQPFQIEKSTLYGFSFKSLRILILRYLFLLSFKIAKKVIFLSKNSEEIIKQKINIDNRTEIVSHGVNYNSDFQFSKNYILKKSVSFIYVSSLDVYKNHIQLLNAFNELRKTLNVNLTIIGSTPYEKKFKEIINLKNKFDPDNNFLFIKKHMSHDDVLNYYNSFDIGIHASSCENFPNIVVEMLSRGLPVITSDISIMREILGKDYIYFDGKNSSSIVEKISEFLQSSKYIDYLNNRKNLFIKNYDLDKQQKKIFQILNNERI